MIVEWNNRALTFVEWQPDVPLPGKGRYLYQTHASLVGTGQSKQKP